MALPEQARSTIAEGFMARALDHLVIGVPDLAAAGARLEALGFVVGPVNRHPWGTENRIVQLGDESFLELVTVGDPALIPARALRKFSFGAFVRDALARRSGLSMLVLKGSDAVRDAAEFATAGIGDFEPFDFSRKGRRPDGSETEVAFSLAFAADAAMPECGFFTCQHHFPQNFWSRQAQDHANGALGIARVTLVAENPSDHHIFLSAFVGERAMRSTSFGIEIATGATGKSSGGVIEIVTAQGFAFRYGLEAPKAETPIFAGIEFLTLDPVSVKSRADVTGAAAFTHADGVTLLPHPDFLTAIRFAAKGAR